MEQISHTRSPSGGFMPLTPPASLDSPALSSTNVAASSTRFLTDLPHPREHAVRPGGGKENMVREYASEKLMTIARRYVKKFSDSPSGGGIVGYTSISEVCQDFDSLINVLWRSGTPSLQVPFLLQIAAELPEYVGKFHPATQPTVKLLRKLDHCFASLARGRDIVTDEGLPGFANGLRSGMTTTDLVRCRSIAEYTRDLLFNLLMDDPTASDDDDADEDEEITGDELNVDAGAEGAVDLIYEKTLLAIAERLGGDVELG